ncbi:bifunctional 1-(5-phosphoribosyl)-5-((5-phosphoribosylamino)methylideneamino)imidazole-4-carboxamide isomerase/phosphoribosylanthranilate isomerase PriA [Arthrobacter sp. HMSC06H05]|uniref:bifunctional 1-(5-phosphoribosyl)-5-((5- phosphoribosylamino)methylideneamino)imidazole-4- carboxamide isomerase/phosphoribosylanthranilate isomerase PriA n=1 Tax=Micrococcaceae TaxID=1268 RepID=UPI0008A3D0EE|nr:MULTISPECIES: bifunctional 1-(5-phosphoribosyl)-5-((5-phosphoribosylamino)methylideneamino)imidazole-4-carboxamide isomerase/phosphoribosylanthranilate isomerase PriA [Micrococcaceae]MCG7304518.1 bifunctional 1-(5-phosphoribosyl)-5-((5-phosphoribosylamino)methylideneamino)imidazole-4-carboxamide isomerase/phosphoribosylanthranilate isomerase PriA [Pseudoglutamicibacter albus]OFT41638.1 bifunctional 1-(5-phosphoribosyl)-5-((5-phosphoribosylamino)methylideneamino)imidazole-4-carboxamide isomeras
MTDHKATAHTPTEHPLTERRELVLFPAVDIVNGQAVRLTQGEAGTETDHGDPFDAALRWQEAGADWIHVVDLDAAFSRGDNRPVLKRIATELDLKVELSGGIRDDASLDRALEWGAARVNIGTAALENPEWTAKAIERVGEAIAVGLDVRGTTLSGHGWTKDGGDLWDVLARLDDAGCARYVVTDVTRDGTMTGPNTELLADIAKHTDKPLIASGGMSTLDDLRALRAMVGKGVEGAIIGRALYNGAFTLEDALAVARGEK